MFDQQTTPSAGSGKPPVGPNLNQPGRQSAPPPNLPGASASPQPLAVPKPPVLKAVPPAPPQGVTPPVEDMFSDTETPAAPRVTRPIQPGQMAQIMPTSGGDVFGGRSIFDNKILVVILSLVGLAVIGGIVWAATSFFSGQFSKSTNVNLNSSVNTNTNANVNTNINANTNTEVNINTNANTNANINTNANANTNAVVAPKDSDGDGLSDDEERQLGTDPNNFDTDGDGLTDRVEVKIYHTDPLKKDTDGDGYDDGMEVINGFDPLKGGGARLFNVPQAQ